MAKTHVSQLALQADRPAAESAPSDPFVAIREIARAAHSNHAFIAATLRHVAQHFRSPYAAAHVRYASEVFQDDCHFGATDPAFWKNSVQDFLTDSLTDSQPRSRVLRGITGQSTIAFIAAPVFDAREAPIGAVALVVALRHPDEVSAHLSTLHAVLRYAALAFESVRPSPASTSTAAGTKPITRVYDSPEQFAFVLTNEIRNKIGCEQVALGLVSGHNVNLLSLSGFDEVHMHGPGIKALRAAMEECLDVRQIVSWPNESHAPEETPRLAPRLHKQWRTAAGGDCVASIPLHHGNAPAAILSLRRSGQPFTGEELAKLQGQVDPLMTNLVLTRLATRSLTQHAGDSLRGFAATLFGPGRLGTKVAAAIITVVTGVLVFGSMEYRVTVPCTVTPAQLRHVSMPFDGIIASANALQGDRVVAGQTLCTLDTVDLDRQRAEFVAQLSVAQREQDRAMAADSAFEAQIAKANQVLIEARLAIVDRRLDQAVVRAPRAGIVLSGDLRKRIGEALPRGEALFQIAPTDEWTLELELPQESLGDVRADFSGVFATHARPEARQEFRIVRILPDAETRERKNVFIGEAELGRTPRTAHEANAASSSPVWLRPGMKGVASIRCGSRRLIWIATHRVVDFLRMHLWL